MLEPVDGAAAEAGETLTIDRNRLLRVVEAHLSIVNRSDLGAVLHDLLDTARDMLGAAYAAVGFVDGSAVAGVDRFVQLGMTPEQVAAIGEAPRWQGLLGTVIKQSGPTRSGDLAAERAPAPVDGQPDVRSFLGVPVHTGDDISGYLYVADAEADRFDDNDEFVLLGIAASVGIAIGNARRAGEIRMRQAWFRASSEITQRLVAREEPDALRLVATRIAELADADIASVVLPTPDPQWLTIAASVGAASEGMEGSLLPVEGSVLGAVMTSGLQEQRTDPVAAPPALAETAERFGPALVMPLVGPSGTRGVLTIARLAGRLPFTALETQMAAVFANHAAIALELMDAQDDRRKVTLFEDRDRIARDLHDNVIQRLFGTGLRLHSLATVARNPAVAAGLLEQTAVLDETIREIRSAIFRLREPDGTTGPELRREVLDVVEEFTPGLGFTPHVGFTGPVDTMASADLAADVVAIVREGLANVARHARAGSSSVELSADGERLVVDVADDGVGIGHTRRRSGLANIEARARARGGVAEVVDGGPGTRLHVELPLRSPV